MWVATLRDLQWRLRRFLIAVAATSLVFSMTLVMAGLTNAFDDEAQRTVGAIGADTWVMRTGVHGAFRSFAAITTAEVDAVAQAPGVERADPVLLLHQAVQLDKVVEVNVLGYRAGGLGEPDVREGRLPAALGEVVADETLGLEVGESVPIGPARLTVVGTVRDVTINAGQPVVFSRIEDASLLLGRTEVTANAVLTRGTPTSLPAALTASSADTVAYELVLPLEKGVQSIERTQYLLWVVAALIIGSVVYLSALERVREFAVLKAIGWTSRDLLSGLAAQAVAVALSSALVAAAVSGLLAKAFPLNVVVPRSAILVLPLVAVVVGLVACVGGLRRAITVDPAVAFGGP
jgi:putative ABC transport system permease protein